MSRADRGAHGLADAVGGSTALIGVTLLGLPEQTGALVGIRDDVGLRVIGAVDLAVALAILRGRPRWPWMALRAAINLPIGGWLIVRGRAASAPSAQLIGAVVASAALLDARIATRLRAAEA